MSEAGALRCRCRQRRLLALDFLGKLSQSQGLAGHLALQMRSGRANRDASRNSAGVGMASSPPCGERERTLS